MIASENLRSQSQSLIRQIWGKYDGQYGFGSLNGTVYDSAWVSIIVQKSGRDGHSWLFPECFQYLLDTQLPDGSWDTGKSQIDNILNTGASLLSLKRHFRGPIELELITRADLQKRITNATIALQAQLDSWDLSSSHQIHFEILVPAILRYLQQEEVVFDFPAKAVLMDYNTAKMSAFQPELLYRGSEDTFIQLLEGFLGEIDFDRLVHHKAKRLMMSSPSSSAAYLMSATEWDSEVERYLRHVIGTRDDGSVPSLYPSICFEYATILATLLRGGFSYSDLACHELDMMIGTLKTDSENENETELSESSVAPNLDDTAKAIMVRSMLNVRTSDTIEGMPSYFGSGAHNTQLVTEPPPAFTTNCHSLLAFLHHKSSASYCSQILKLVEYLCACWWSTDSSIKDKRHLGRIYPQMLLVQAFSDFLAFSDRQVIPDMCSSHLKAKVSICVVQACHRTMLEQEANGSWSDSPEQTACGVLLLSECRRLTFLESVEQKINQTIATGIEYLQSFPLESLPLERFWNGKTISGSRFLTLSFVLAAMKSAEKTTPLEKRGTCLEKIYPTKLQHLEYMSLFRQTPMFSEVPHWELATSCLEGVLYESILRTHRLDVFPRKNMSEDKYFGIIPFTWTACNNHLRLFASSSFLYEMMVISFLNYQVDEFMEAVATPCFANKLEELGRLVSALVLRDIKPVNFPSSYQPVLEPLGRFVAYVLDHPLATMASRRDYQCLQRELRFFLLAHVQQAKDSAKFNSSPQKGIFYNAELTFFNWVRTTSADHTSCPYSFWFVSCLLSGGPGQGDESFPTANSKYFGEAVCRHLASMCRMYNDYGSVSRDTLEGNLNSTNFPEFHDSSLNHIDTSRSDILQMKKNVLFVLAEYERGCLDQALVKLQGSFECPSMNPTQRKNGQRSMKFWRMFCSITDLYGQIYCVRDIASRMGARRSESDRQRAENGAVSLPEPHITVP